MAEGGFSQRRVQLSKPEREHGEALPWVRVCFGWEQGEATVPRAHPKREARSGTENGGLLGGANSGMASGVMGWIASPAAPGLLNSYAEALNLTMWLYLEIGSLKRWLRAWQPPPIFLPGESHGQRSLAGYSPWGIDGSDTTEQLTVKVKGGH